MTDTRRRLTGILEEPGLPANAMASVAAKTGFDAPKPPEPSAPAEPEPVTTLAIAAPGRKRQGVGRSYQFTTRIKPEAAEIMNADSITRNVPIADVLEEALADLKAKRERQASGQS